MEYSRHGRWSFRADQNRRIWRTARRCCVRKCRGSIGIVTLDAELSSRSAEPALKVNQSRRARCKPCANGSTSFRRSRSLSWESWFSLRCDEPRQRTPMQFRDVLFIKIDRLDNFTSFYKEIKKKKILKSIVIATAIYRNNASMLLRDARFTYFWREQDA